MKDLASNLFVLVFLLAYSVVFILLLQWMVRRWWEDQRRPSPPWHPAGPNPTEKASATGRFVLPALFAPADRAARETVGTMRQVP
jgi:hypothetical protein